MFAPGDLVVCVDAKPPRLRGLSRDLIGKIKRGEIWTHVTGFARLSQEICK